MVVGTEVDPCKTGGANKSVPCKPAGAKRSERIPGQWRGLLAKYFSEPLMEKTLTYNPSDFTGGKGYIDLARGFAIANRKMYNQVDGKGVAQTYVVEVELIGSTAQERGAAFYSAPESWAVKNAIKRLHIARQESFKKAGILTGSLPSYSRNLKFYLDQGHRATGTLRPVGYSPSTSAAIPAIQTFADSEWLYTRLAQVGGVEGGTGGPNTSDDYELTLMGDHDVDATGNYQTYNSVAIVRAYLEHRRNKSPNMSQSTGDVIQEDPNPLALLMNDSYSGQEKAEIAAESQDVDPPYQVASGSWAGTDALDLHLRSFLQTSTASIRDRDVIRVPAGLLMCVHTPANSMVRFHLHGIEDMQG